MVTQNQRAAKAGIDKFGMRRDELATSALVTLAERGYAHTGLRDIAENSDFSHGVLHYYFTDKNDLIQHCVRLYKTDCATHYDEIVATAVSGEELATRFGVAMGETLRDDASMHRLWYDLRNQSMFQSELADVIREIDGLLQQMIWQLVSRYAELTGSVPVVEPALAYAMYDGMFEQSLVAYLAGDLAALDRVTARCEQLLQLVVPVA